MKESFKIGNQVKVVNSNKTYDLFEELVNKYAGVHKRKFVSGYIPSYGDKGVIVAIEKHPRQDVLTAIVATKKHVYAIRLDGLENLQQKKVAKYQPSKLSVREVKRPAKIGEWIKIIHSGYEKNFFKVGDVLKVLEVNPLGELKINEERSCWSFVSNEDGYVVLENYQPEVKVKSLADYTNKELVDELARRLEG